MVFNGLGHRLRSQWRDQGQVMSNDSIEARSDTIPHMGDIDYHIVWVLNSFGETTRI